MSSAEMPTWYDLLGVAPDASEDEIRAAWKAGIADLEPGDRRFDTLNRAARVLLDPSSRAEYDATLGEPVAEPPPAPEKTPAPEPKPEPKPAPEPGPEAPATSEPEPDTEPAARAETDGETRGRRGVPAIPAWVLAVLAVLATAAVVSAAVLWATQDGLSEEEVRAAQAAAEEAVVPVLSYDHETLEEDGEAARSHLTPDYREDYDELFAVIEENAPRTKTTVDVEVLASGIVRTGEDRVDVLVFVDRPTTNKLSQEPVVYRDQVTLTMERVGDEWLVDDMVTTPAPS